MSYKCSICNCEDVFFPGDICERCSLERDSNDFAVNYRDKDLVPAGENYEVDDFDSTQNNVIYGEDFRSQSQSFNGNITSGIAKNITTDGDRKLFIVRWFRSLFLALPYSLDSQVTTFQLFSDYAGMAFSSSGTVAHQVVLYGKIKTGLICDNNEVEVHGSRDRNNNIIASKIVNKTSGAVIKPVTTVPFYVIWAITLFFSGALFTVWKIYGIMPFLIGLLVVLALSNIPLTFRVLGGILLTSLSIASGVVFGVIRLFLAILGLPFSRKK